MSVLMLVLLAPLGVLFALVCIQKPLTVALPVVRGLDPVREPARDRSLPLRLALLDPGLL